MTKEEMESCLDTIGVYRSVLSFMNITNKDSCEDRDMHIENLDKLDEMLRTEWKHEQSEADAIPVEWIETKMKKLKDMDGGYSCLAADILYGILIDWRREQGRRYVPGD